MSQSSFLSSAEATPAPPPEVADGSSRRPLIIAAVAAVLVLAVAAYFLLFSGTDDEVAVLLPVAPAAGPAVESTTGPTPEAIAKTTPPSISTDGVDPFKALVVDDSAAQASSGQGSAPAVAGPTQQPAVQLPTTGSGLPAVDVPVTVVPGSPVPTGGATPSATPATEFSVEVFSVQDDNLKAVIDVNGKEFDVVTGGTFAEGFSLVRIEDGTCTTIKFQDDSFDLCEGDTRKVS